jgi:capsule polysaccharide export protein KpsE/RkpR
VEELNQHIESDEISLKELIIKGKEIWQFLLRKWFIIIVAAFIGASIGVANAWLTKTKYIATLSFSVENEKSNPLGNLSGLASMAGVDIGGGGGTMFSSDNIMSIMTSRNMVVKTMLSPITVDNKKITLIEYYLAFNNINKKWSENTKLAKLKYPLNLNSDSLTRLQDSILWEIHKSIIKDVLSVNKPDKKLSLIEASCTSTNEDFSKTFIETLNDKVTDFYISIKTKRLKQNVDILQNRADSIYRSLSNSLIGSATLADQNLNMAKQAGGVARQKKQIDLQVASTAYGEIIKNLEIAKITLQKETPLIQVIDQPVFPLLKEKASRLKGLLIGGFLAGFLMVGFLLLQKWYREMMAEEKQG